MSSGQVEAIFFGAKNEIIKLMLCHKLPEGGILEMCQNISFGLEGLKGEVY